MSEPDRSERLQKLYRALTGRDAAAREAALEELSSLPPEDLRYLARRVFINRDLITQRYGLIWLGLVLIVVILLSIPIRHLVLMTPLWMSLIIVLFSSLILIAFGLITTIRYEVRIWRQRAEWKRESEQIEKSIAGIWSNEYRRTVLKHTGYLQPPFRNVTKTLETLDAIAREGDVRDLATIRHLAEMPRGWVLLNDPYAFGPRTREKHARVQAAARECLEALEARGDIQAQTLPRPASAPESEAAKTLLRPAGNVSTPEERLLRPVSGGADEAQRQNMKEQT